MNANLSKKEGRVSEDQRELKKIKPPQKGQNNKLPRRVDEQLEEEGELDGLDFVQGQVIKIH